MRNRLQIYWIAQLGGWGLFVAATIVIANLWSQNTTGLYNFSLCILLTGILLTHAFRWCIHRLGWKRMNILKIILIIIPTSLLLSFLFISINTAFSNVLYQRFLFDTFFARDFWLTTFNYSALFLLWSIIYFAVNTFENWKREEIQNLELRAAKTEIELNSFKAQMNPHFMFNSLNSIRALVEENPDKAKEAITKLSGLLRNNLTLGRSQTIPLRDELDLVDKYLSLEKIRFEERLHVYMDIDAQSLRCEVPPFMLQTIVENAIKHGISKQLEGGTINISVKRNGDTLSIVVSNTGSIKNDDNSTGIGLTNTRKRLQLLYGEQANFLMAEDSNMVTAHLTIPINQTI
ncbi:MAG: sensor histidine kinase [Flavobacteriales bacterium]